MCGIGWSKDMVIPRLQIAQKVGPLSEVKELDFGDLVLGESCRIAGAGEPVLLTVLACRKYFRENLKYDRTGPKPRIWDTESELQAAGMTLEWKGQKPNSIPPTAVPIADADVLIEKPEDLETPVF